jgi:ADP-ribosylglycohydrolase
LSHSISIDKGNKNMKLNVNEYQDKVLGCWMGKNIGGTLGAPFEWRRQINQVSFYTQELQGEPLPNDDLDIQLLWLIALEEMGVDIDAHTLAEYWTLYVTPHWSEYGTAKINLRAGLVPPLSGTLHNDYKDSCGSFIRSEIWACIAPGSPSVAAWYAYQDAILDHGNGEGVFAEVFCAALESAAFVEQDLSNLIEIGLSFIPESCWVSKAVQDAIHSYKSGKTWLAARDSILQSYRGLTFMNQPQNTSADDWSKGFGDGQRGWDVPSNIGMLILSLLYGEGDFSRTICTAVNCGEDTDCTGATAGSIWGILHGCQNIPQEWIAPIGRKIKTACLNLGELGYFGNQLPADIENLTLRTEKIALQVALHHHLEIDFTSEVPTDRTDFSPEKLKANPKSRLLANLQGPCFRFGFFEIAIDYGSGPVIHPAEPNRVKLRIYNDYKIQARLKIHWYAPTGWQITPAGDLQVLSFPAHLGDPKEIEFQVIADPNGGESQRAVVEIVIDSRPSAMLIPILLINEID